MVKIKTSLKEANAMEMDELLIKRDTQPNDDSQENGLLLSGPEASSPPQNQQHSAPPAAQPGELGSIFLVSQSVSQSF